MNVLITGAARGIGLALTQHYLNRGDNVLAVCRHETDELKATNAHIIAGIDVSHAADINKLKVSVSDTPIDILINNAGIFSNQTLAELDFTEIDRQWQVNALAPLRVTHALLGNLEAGSKIALITSRMGSIGDNGSGAYYGYRMSKAALNAAGKSLAIDVKHRGISVAILHPGMVSTRMIGFNGDVTPEVSAERLMARIDALDLSNTGTFWHANGDVLPW